MSKAVIGRRAFIRNSAVTGTGFAFTRLLWQKFTSSADFEAKGRATRLLNLDRDWIFAGASEIGGAQLAESAFLKLNLPHCLAKPSWQNWGPATWEYVWNYRRCFTLPGDFRGCGSFCISMVSWSEPPLGSKVIKCRNTLEAIFSFEYGLTPWVKTGENLLKVLLDSRWRNVPPEGAAAGPKSIDYLEAGGIYRSRDCRRQSIFLR